MRCVSARFLSSNFRVVCPTHHGTFRPPYKTYRGAFNYYPMKIGDFVHIGANTIVEAATIGNHVEIGKNCVIVSNFSASSPWRLTYSLHPAGEIHNYQGLCKDCG
jgi:acetyltransferase-like isoleucine patch superfamily enzyme